MNSPKQEKATTRDKVFTIVGIVLCVILIPMLIINVTMIIQSYTNKDKVPNFLGLTPLIVLSDSMYPEIESGDLIFCVHADPSEIGEKDVISFFDPASSSSAVVTHRVEEIIDDGDGTLSFRTKGDANNATDAVLVSEEKLVGIYKFRISGAGNVAMFMQTTPGLIVCVFVPMLLFIGYDVVRRRLYEQNKKDDMEVLLAELAALKEEKAKTEQENEDKKE